MRSPSRILYACLFLILGMAAHARAEDTCSPILIHALPDRPIVGVGDINNWGQVAATSGAPGGVVNSIAFVWHHGRTTELKPLEAGGSSVAESLNDLGQVVGRSSIGMQQVATLWTGGVAALLPGRAGTASRINNRGQIAGRDGSFCLFWRTPASEPLVIADVGGDSCEPNGINDWGVVVGATRTADGLERAFVWSEHAGVQFVDAPSSVGNNAFVSLNAINSQGLAVGYALNGVGRRLLAWTRSEGSRVVRPDLDGLAADINNWGWAAGLGGDAANNLTLFDVSGARGHTYSIPAVNGDELYLNDLFQIAWNALDGTAYTCQLRK